MRLTLHLSRLAYAEARVLDWGLEVIEKKGNRVLRVRGIRFVPFQSLSPGLTDFNCGGLAPSPRTALIELHDSYGEHATGSRQRREGLVNSLVAREAQFCCFVDRWPASILVERMGGTGINVRTIDHVQPRSVGSAVNTIEVGQGQRDGMVHSRWGYQHPSPLFDGGLHTAWLGERSWIERVLDSLRRIVIEDNFHRYVKCAPGGAAGGEWLLAGAAGAKGSMGVGKAGIEDVFDAPNVGEGVGSPIEKDSPLPGWRRAANDAGDRHIVVCPA